LELAPGALRVVLQHAAAGAEALVALLRLVHQAVGGERLRELQGEEDAAAGGPALRLPEAGDPPVALHPDLGPQHLAVVVVDAADQVEDHPAAVARGERVAIDAHPARGPTL